MESQHMLGKHQGCSSQLPPCDLTRSSRFSCQTTQPGFSSCKCWVSSSWSWNQAAVVTATSWQPSHATWELGCSGYCHLLAAFTCNLTTPTKNSATVLGLSCVHHVNMPFDNSIFKYQWSKYLYYCVHFLTGEIVFSNTMQHRDHKSWHHTEIQTDCCPVR